jgi:hypothetical protein
LLSWADQRVRGYNCGQPVLATACIPQFFAVGNHAIPCAASAAVLRGNATFLGAGPSPSDCGNAGSSPAMYIWCYSWGSQPPAHDHLDCARGWTAADITPTGGREDGARPLFAVAPDRSSGVAGLRDCAAAHLMAPREGLRSKPLSRALVARSSLQVFGNSGLPPILILGTLFPVKVE